MKNTDTKQLRAKADAIAARVAAALGLKSAPKCRRIVRRRGQGSPLGFSIPAWAARNEAYFAYYVAHEVCHADPRDSFPGHGPVFRRLEAIALAELNLEPIYERNGAGPYVEALKSKTTGALVCCTPKVGKWFRGPYDPPTVYTLPHGGAQ